MWEYSFFRQHYGHYHWLDDTLSLAGVNELPDYDRLLAEGALAAWARDRFARSLILADRADEAARALGHPPPLPALKARFNVAVHQERLHDAGQLLNQLLAESAAQASPRYHADNLVVLTLGLAQSGMASEATQAAAEALDLARPTGNPTSISWAGVAGGSAQLLSDPRQAARAFSAASRLARTVRNHWVNGMALSGLVTALRRQGQTAQARQLLVEVVDLWGRNRSAGQLSRACQESILLLAEGGQGEAAARLLARLELVDQVPLHNAFPP